MKKPGSRYLLMASHLLAVAAGWAVWTAAHPEQPGRIGSEAANGKFRSADRGKAEKRGGWILDQLAQDKKLTVERQVKRSEAFKIRLVEAADLNKLADAMPPADDPAAASMKSLEAYFAAAQNGSMGAEEQAQAEIRMLQWMRADTAAVFAWFASKPQEQWATGTPFFRKALDALIVTKGSEEATKWMGANGRMDKELARLISDHAGATADIGQLQRIKAGLDPQRWNEVRLPLIDTWPFEKADDLMRLSISENAPLTVLLYAKGQGPAGVEWLQRQLASGSMDPAFRSSVLKHVDYHKLMFASPQLDFDTRVQVVTSFDPGKPVEQVKMELGVLDVVNAMNAGRDWRYAFRMGAATADEIYAEMAKALPELAAKSPESLRLQLFKELSEFGGGKAIGLLDGLPEDKKWEMAMKAPQWQFENGNPQDFYDFLQNVPAEAGPVVWDTRLNSWENKTARNQQRLGSQYTEWVLGLPPGLDGEMASYALLTQSGSKDPELSERLLAKIKDPKLQQLLEARR